MKSASHKLNFRELDDHYTFKNQKILEYFGENHQYKKLIEEIKELEKVSTELFDHIKFWRQRKPSGCYDHYRHECAKTEEEIKSLEDILLGTNKLFDHYYEEVDKLDIYEEGVLSEIADCLVIADQLKERDFVLKIVGLLFLEADSILNHMSYSAEIQDQVFNIMIYKIDRTLQRYSIKV